MNKLKLDGTIVVEGRDDKTALSRVIDANIFVLNGMNGVNKKNVDMLKKIAQNNKIYILTDPDFAGKKIRQILNENIPNLINLYAKRQNATLNNNVGVENLCDFDILEIFKNIRQVRENKEELFTMEDIMNNNLNSKIRRQILGDILNISYLNTKQLLKMLNTLNITRDEFFDAIKKIDLIIKTRNKNGVIFGKFFPIHLGHVNFIKEASKYCKKLYVFVCEETKRDEKLNEISKFPKLNIQDRENFVKKELRGYKNIQVLILNEDGIKQYPDGWQEWTKRVMERRKELKIEFDTVFTNEIQDKPNYEKYFGMNVIHIDINRTQINISSTKIRTEPNKYIEYMPNSVKEFYRSNCGG